MHFNKTLKLLFITTYLGMAPLMAQETLRAQLTIHPRETKQTVVGFGASLAFYENWLNAHPKKGEIYEAIFGELSLDILRVRNAYDYDPGMVGRVKEYMAAAENSLGHPIALLSTSWGPPGYLKNTGDRNNGGTLRYTLDGGNVKFDYAGFAQWWNGSLDEYLANGIFPTYISIQNEPRWSAFYESCLLYPQETINSTDTIAGYNKALDAVYDTLNTRSSRPQILGPEPLGIGYNLVESYMSQLDISKLDGMAHHLYHGVDENNPFASTEFAKLGDLHPELPHFQTEFSRGDWFSLAGLIYKSFWDEQVVAYLYWDLIWNEGGLVQLDFPWDISRWIDPQKGYTKTKDFYAFKQYSAFVHPGWKMTHHSPNGANEAALTFISPTGDSAACVIINRSAISNLSVHLDIPGYRIHESAIYSTSATENCEFKGELIDSVLTLVPHSISTVDMRIVAYDPADDTEAPSIPTGISISDSSSTSLTMIWNSSTDNTGVKGYRIYLDGVLHATTRDTLYEIKELAPNTTYMISVSAFDEAGNESGKSEDVLGTIRQFDTTPPLLNATSSIYQEGIIEVVSSEAGVVYLVPENTTKDLASIREVFIDSIEVAAKRAASLFVSELANGIYWLFASDSAENISEPAALTVLGVGIESLLIHSFEVYPNPISQLATFKFSLKKGQDMCLTLMDNQGRLVRKEYLGILTAGEHELIFHRDGLAEGLYFFRLESPDIKGISGTLMMGD
jgi:glucuronoarabinoxylan endo-1,4-beta-xylanase